jgi:hypothetical protein
LLVIQVRPPQEQTELNLLSEFRGPPQTAGEINPKSKSAEEVTEFWKYLKAIMEKEKRRGRATSTTY